MKQFQPKHHIGVAVYKLIADDSLIKALEKIPLIDGRFWPMDGL